MRLLANSTWRNTLPEQELAAADRRARALDRSRSWIVRRGPVPNCAKVAERGLVAVLE